MIGSGWTPYTEVVHAGRPAPEKRERGRERAHARDPGVGDPVLRRRTTARGARFFVDRPVAERPMRDPAIRHRWSSSTRCPLAAGIFRTCAARPRHRRCRSSSRSGGTRETSSPQPGLSASTREPTARLDRTRRRRYPERTHTPCRADSCTRYRRPAPSPCRCRTVVEGGRANRSTRSSGTPAVRLALAASRPRSALPVNTPRRSSRSCRLCLAARIASAPECSSSLEPPAHDRRNMLLNNKLNRFTCFIFIVGTGGSSTHPLRVLQTQSEGGWDHAGGAIGGSYRIHA